MKLDAFFPPETRLSAIPELARAAERMGFDATWMAETQHNPFLACTLIAEHTKRLHFGTAIAVSFARSPAVMAHAAWDLADYSAGRFLLGLGTQVRAHIERRFGMPWPDSPVSKLREQIRVLSTFWKHWQTGKDLKHRGEYYRISLSSPFFTPAAIDEPDIPIYLAGVNRGLARLAGEAANGFLVHPFHSKGYLQEVLLPAINQGTASAARRTEEVQVVVNAFVVSGEEERELARQQISFYASTPSYRSVMALHGWEETAQQLSVLAARQGWEEMPGLISDEMLETFATVAAEVDLPAALLERYEGVVHRLALYRPFVPGERDTFWRHLRKEVNP